MGFFLLKSGINSPVVGRWPSATAAATETSAFEWSYLLLSFALSGAKKASLKSGFY
jgi:hypothetical protein